MQAMPRTIFANIHRQTSRDFCPRFSHSWVRDRRLRSTSHVEPTGVIGMSSLSFWISHMRCHSISPARKKIFRQAETFRKMQALEGFARKSQIQAAKSRHPIVPIYADGRTKAPLPQTRYLRPTKIPAHGKDAR